MNLLTGIPIVGELIKTVFGSRLERDRFQADARSAVYQQFAAEFGHGKTWWDSLIDGLNRLPRPIMTFGVIYLFVWCARDPAAFVEYAIALQAMPKEGWFILGAVVTFWFAAKLPKDFGKYKVNGEAMQVAKQISDSREMQTTAPPTTKDPQEGIEWDSRVKNRYAKDWDNLND